MGDSSSDSELEEFSGIEQPPLLQQLKTILDEYRNDVQIIKELVQNADDAEATVMKVLYNGRTINAEQPKEGKYRKFVRAPALAFYNDAMFTDDDWRGIRSIYSSVKKNDPLKIGRFGLGFKSVFHLTDYPCIISGENILFINPHERTACKVCVLVKLKNLKRSKLMKKLKFEDLMAVLDGTFGFSEKSVEDGNYRGTLFWFPLRQTPSELSDDVYNDKNVDGLLQAFLIESRRSLLFLKTLCRIELFVDLLSTTEQEDRSPKQKRRRLLKSATRSELANISLGKNESFYAVFIDNASNNLSQKRKTMLKELKQIGDAVPEESKVWTHDLFVETESKNISAGNKRSEERWLVVNYLKGGYLSDRIKTLKKDKDLLYPHLVGLAAPIHEDSKYDSTEGHVFCYQPLPQESSAVTGLPVHVNAFFALSQNRRHIRWPDEDDKGLANSDKKIEWNLRLRSEILPEAYLKLIEELVELSTHENNVTYLLTAVYNSIADLERVDHHWNDLAQDVLQLIIKQRKEIFYVERCSKWLNITDIVIADYRMYSQDCFNTVVEFLKQDKIAVCEVPDSVTDSFKSLYAEIVFVTPQFLQDHLTKTKTYKNLSRAKKKDLLEFVLLESLSDNLDAVELVPLANDTFCGLSSKRPVFVESAEVICLFPGHEGRFLHPDIRKSLLDRLQIVTVKGKLIMLLITVALESFEKMRQIQRAYVDIIFSSQI